MGKSIGIKTRGRQIFQTTVIPQSVLAHDLGYWDYFFPASWPNETNTLKLLNHQMAFNETSLDTR